MWETAVGIVGLVVGPLYLGGLDDAVIEAEVSRQLDRPVELRGRQAGGTGRDGQGARSEDLVGGGREEGAVDAAGEGDDDGLHFPEAVLEGILFLVERRGLFNHELRLSPGVDPQKAPRSRAGCRLGFGEKSSYDYVNNSTMALGRGLGTA